MDTVLVFSGKPRFLADTKNSPKATPQSQQLHPQTWPTVLGFALHFGNTGTEEASTTWALGMRTVPISQHEAGFVKHVLLCQGSHLSIEKKGLYIPKDT